MNLSRPFILRPAGTTLMALGVALAGMIAFTMLPVAPLPQVEFPVISVQATLPGASPETMAATVATPLERTLGTISGVNEITSTSSLSSTRVTLQFDLDKDIDQAAREVQAGINAARAMLPTSLPNNPTYRKVNPAASPVMIVSLTSETLSRGQMYDAASTVLAQRISQIEGVGQVNVGGGALPAVRVAVDLPALAATGVSMEEVRGAIVASNANRPKGMVESDERHWQIGANDQAQRAADYRPLVVSWRNNAPLRLSEIARVSDSVQDTRNMGLTDGKPSVQMIIYRQPGANIIETVERVKAELPRLAEAIPQAIDVDVVMERTTTIRASLREIERALALSVGLVILVVFLFLRQPRAAIIPAVSVPLSLAATFAVMYLLGYSLNNLSLMAMTVATGFVVDDAIVVLENIVRRLEAGERPLEAAMRGAREVGFTVVSMSLSLVAVFIPVLAMGGIVGRLFREFAVTLTVAILVSLVVSLTVTPMLCARWLKARPQPAPDDADGGDIGVRDLGGPGAAAEGLPASGMPAVNPAALRSRFARRLRRLPGAILRAIANSPRLAFEATQRGYARSLGWSLRHPAVVMLVLLLVIGGNVWLYRTVPKGFFPRQDTGLLVGSIQADQASSFQSMSRKVTRYVEIVRQDEAVAHVTAFTGGGQRNSGFVFVVLKPLAERGISADQVIARLRPKIGRVPGASLFLQPSQDVRVGGRQTGAAYQYALQADDLALLRAWEPTIRATLGNLPQLADVNTDAQDKGLQTLLAIDRDEAARLGVSVRAIDATLNDAFGQRQVSTIHAPLNQYRVVLEADERFQLGPDSLQELRVSGTGGASVPLPVLATHGPGQMPLAVNHQSGFASSTISFNLAEGVALSDATAAVRDALANIGLPAGITASFQGTARAFQKSLESQPLLILAAIVTIYLVLGVLYESLVHPITILSTLPSAGAGAILGLMVMDMEFTVIALIGVILLIGIVKKNAIMMIDVAIESTRSLGMSPRDAIHHACLLRFRPIMMTTVAALFGALPLALVTGDGAELRQPLGVSVVGGLLVSQWLTLYTTPVVYLLLDRLRNRVLRRAAPADAPPPGPAPSGVSA